MAFSKRKRRRITVDEQTYFWAVNGNDGWIDLYVMADFQGGQKLHCSLDYHEDETPHEHGVGLSNQFVVTPYIVRQAIEYALTQGWEPLEKGTELRLGNVDEKIDLRLDQNRESVIKGV